MYGVYFVNLVLLAKKSKTETIYCNGINSFVDMGPCWECVYEAQEYTR